MRSSRPHIQAVLTLLILCSMTLVAQNPKTPASCKSIRARLRRTCDSWLRRQASRCCCNRPARQR